MEAGLDGDDVLTQMHGGEVLAEAPAANLAAVVVAPEGRLKGEKVVVQLLLHELLPDLRLCC